MIFLFVKPPQKQMVKNKYLCVLRVLCGLNPFISYKLISVLRYGFGAKLPEQCLITYAKCVLDSNAAIEKDVKNA